MDVGTFSEEGEPKALPTPTLPKIRVNTTRVPNMTHRGEERPA